jgi:hypothetical protein
MSEYLGLDLSRQVEIKMNNADLQITLRWREVITKEAFLIVGSKVVSYTII